MCLVELFYFSLCINFRSPSSLQHHCEQNFLLLHDIWEPVPVLVIVIHDIYINAFVTIDRKSCDFILFY